MNHLIDSTGRFIDLIAPLVTEEGYALVKIAQEGSDRRGITLTIMVEPDRAQTLTLDDCARLSRAISATLDVEDPISGAYILEVGSPGIDRPLTRLKDFEAAQGKRVKIETNRPMANGQKKFDGVLTACDAEQNRIILSLKDSDEEITLALPEVKKAKLVFTENLLKQKGA